MCSVAPEMCLSRGGLCRKPWVWSVSLHLPQGVGEDRGVSHQAGGQCWKLEVRDQVLAGLVPAEASLLGPWDVDSRLLPVSSVVAPLCVSMS